ncbi:MAG: hypothetical protein R3B48_02955 [Kofleriaceae bacterium]
MITLTAKLGVDNAVAVAALKSWGAGRYDARFNQDTESHPVMLPPAYGLRDVALETYTGEGPVSNCNASGAVTQIGGQGTYKDERVGIDLRHSPDRVTPILQALRDYQFSLEPPAPLPGSYDAAAAHRGKLVFDGQAKLLRLTAIQVPCTRGVVHGY